MSNLGNRWRHLRYFPKTLKILRLSSWHLLTRVHLKLNCFEDCEFLRSLKQVLLHAETENGMQVVEVIELSDETVTIDGNHPLAGVELHFDIEVVEVREATATELEHGHIHAAGDSCDADAPEEEHVHSESCNH